MCAPAMALTTLVLRLFPFPAISVVGQQNAGMFQQGMQQLPYTGTWNLNPPTPVPPATPCDCDSVFNQFDDAYKCPTC